MALAMADTPTAKTALVQTAKAGGIASTLLVALTQLPQPYAHWVEIGLSIAAILGFVATQIPAPPAGSKLWPVYRALNVFAANWGQAANAAILMRTKAAATPSEPKAN